MSAVWERSRVRQLYRNTLTTDFAQAFQNDHNNIDVSIVVYAHFFLPDKKSFLLKCAHFYAHF